MIDLDCEIRERANEIIDQHDKTLCVDCRTSADMVRILRDVIDAHECPAGHVSDELRERVKHLRRVGLGYVSLEFWRDLAKEAIVTAQDLLAIADAKPGWVEGPPTKTGWQVLDMTGRGMLQLVDVALPSGFSQVVRHFHISPKREPVVDCCDFGRAYLRYSEIADGWQVHEQKTGEHYVKRWDFDTCLCGTKLSELEE